VLARQLWPEGELIPWTEGGAEAALAATREALARRAPVLFEATFEHEGVLVRTDVLLREGDAHALIEVKSSKEVSSDHEIDVAVQWWVLQGCGVPVARAAVLHLRDAARSADPSDLFAETDVTAGVQAHQTDLSRQISDLRRQFAADVAPEVHFGQPCGSASSPCEFLDHCRREAGVPTPSVLDLPELRGKRWQMFEKYGGALPAAPDPAFGPVTTRALRAHHSGRREVDTAGLANALRSWSYPLLHLDFETWNPAVPRVPGTRPSEVIPVQFSLHAEEAPGAEVAHHEHLDTDPTDPRPGLARALAQALERHAFRTGTITAWNMHFERAVLKKLADHVEDPGVAATLRDAESRLVDPMAVVKNHVYDPEFGPSFSLKPVTRALLGPDFDHGRLAITNGADAMVAYERLRDPATPPGTREALRESLLAYCRHDTLTVLEIVRLLRKLARL
jgi:predicted RecB family nuclease